MEYGCEGMYVCVRMYECVRAFVCGRGRERGGKDLGWCLHCRHGSILDLWRRHVVCVTSGGPNFSNHIRTSSCTTNRRKQALPGQRHRGRALTKSGALRAARATHSRGHKPRAAGSATQGASGEVLFSCPLARRVRGADRASTQHTSTHRPRPRSVSRATVRDSTRKHARAQSRRGRARRIRPPALTPCLTMYCPLEQSSALITRTLHAGTAASADAVCPSQAVTILPCPASPPARALPSMAVHLQGCSLW